MKRTRLSLYYLIGYLVPGGLALLAFPRLTLKLFFSNTDYGDVLPRLVGTPLVHCTASAVGPRRPSRHAVFAIRAR